MYKHIFTLCFLLTTHLLFAQKTINDPNAEVRNLSGFHSIQVSNSFDVFITQGTEEKVVVSANDAEDIGNIVTVVENGVLKISFDNKSKWWPKNRKLKAYIACTKLEKLKAGGAADIFLEGDIKAEDLELYVSGASELKGRLQVSGKLSINLSGASDVNISGSAANTVIDANGASDFDGFEFSTQVCDAHASGASSVKMTVDKELSARLSGASSFRYKGEAIIRNIQTSGASSISRRS